LLARGLAVLLLAGIAAVNVSYWQDPPYWRRWWILMTNLAPDHMDFRPTLGIGGGLTRALPTARPDGLTIDPRSLRAAERYAADFDSYALIVIHWDVVQTEWYRDGWHRERLTQSQSMMKTIAAIAVGLAIEDGSIGSVDEPVSRYLPEWLDDPRGAISVRDFLTMSTGLAQYRFTLNPWAGDSAFRLLNASDRTAVLLSTPLVSSPGTTFDYNDVDAALIGLVVQRATGIPWPDYLDRRLWQPMGGAPAEVWLDRAGEGSLAMTACCMLASAPDWARIGLLLKDRGMVAGKHVVPAGWIDAMTQPSRHYAGYGYFTWLGTGIGERGRDPGEPETFQAEDFLADDVFMLIGRGGQRVYVSRDSDLVIVRLGPHNGMEPLNPGWDNSRLFNIIAGGIKRTAGSGGESAGVMRRDLR
jgi:CubicO group peptidase (beta-lactamase class C family)